MAVELRQLPVNTVLNGLCDETQKDAVNEHNDDTTATAADAADAADNDDNDVGESDKQDEDGAVAAEDDKNVEVSLLCFMALFSVLYVHQGTV